MELPEKYDRSSKSLKISVLEAVCGFRVSFLSLCFLGDINLMSWQFRGQLVLFTKIIALKTLVKTVTVAFIVKYISSAN